MQSIPQISSETKQAWRDRAPEAATYVMDRLAARVDCYGWYAPGEVTIEPGWRTVKRPLTTSIVERSFSGDDGTAIALHTTNADNKVKRITGDYDRHDGDGEEVAEHNEQNALTTRDKLITMGLNPLLTDSNRRGGFHLDIILADFIAADVAYRFAQIVFGGQCECFPKQSQLEAGQFGNFVRLFGRHPKHRDHWTRVYDRDGGWLEGHSAIDEILSRTGDDPKIIIDFIAKVDDAGKPESVSSKLTERKNDQYKTPDDEIAKRCLSALPNNDVHYDDWLKVLASAKSVGTGNGVQSAALEWSRKSPKHDDGTFNRKWESLNRTGGTVATIATLIHLARQAGYDVYEDLKRNRPARQNGQHHTAPGNSANATDTTGEPTPRFPLTDIGLSDRYETQNRADVRYCYPRNKHIIYTEARWQWDESGLAVARGKQTALSILAEAQNEPDDSRRSALIKFAMASQKRERITAMLALAQPDLAISPDALDRDPNLLNCPNGTVDLRTGELKSHRREDFLTKITGIEYHPDAQAPIFTAMLKRIFRSNPSVIPFGQRAIGYSATGLVREQCVFFAYGRGRNGKTTFIDAVMNVLGDYAAKADPDLLMMRDGSPAHPTNIADLMGSRMAVCSETGDGRRFDESRFKDLSGETRIKARFLYGDFFQIDATWKIWMYSNHRPVVRGTDLGFWRRMKVIPFLETISDDECDPDLPHKLKSEAAGILAWIVRGAVAYHREGLCEPAEVKAAVADYRSQMDSLGTFLAEHCTEGDRISVYSADLYATYSKWCESAGEHAVSQKKLGTNLAERGYVSERCSYSGRMKWLGIGIQAEKNQA